MAKKSKKSMFKKYMIGGKLFLPGRIYTEDGMTKVMVELKKPIFCIKKFCFPIADEYVKDLKEVMYSKKARNGFKVRSKWVVK